MKPLASLLTFIAVAPLLSSITDAAEAPRPNIVIILCDDLGYSDVGFNGSTDIRTPELDQLAKSGTICTSAYVAHPFCGPSRMGLMAGRYPHAFGAPFNLPNSGHGIEEYNKQGIPVSETLMSTVLQKSGYYTGAMGKWHMGINPEFHPNKRGFDDFYGFLGGGHAYFPEKYGPIHERQTKAGNTKINDYFLPLEHNGKVVKETEYMTDALSREAVRFVNDATQKKQPFFLYLSYNAPHTPLEAKEEDLKLYAHITNEKRRNYAAMVHAVDRGVGQVVKSLKSTGQFDNTLIVFFSDNGGKLSAGATNKPLSKGKGDVSEGGWRVPMFFHWPKHVPAGVKFTHPISSLDLYPTFAGLANAEIPEGKVLDGKNIWADFTAGKDPRKGDLIFALRHRDGFSDVGARLGKWKIRRLSQSGPWKLFDIEADIGETKDLSAQYPERLKDMVAQAQKWSLTHTAPLWFHELKARDQWKESNMPKFDETFKMSPGGSNPAPKKSDEPAEPTPPKKLAKGDTSKADFIAKEKIKWEKNGWKWNQAKVEELFKKIDTNGDGVASGQEKKAHWSKAGQ